MKGFQCVGWIWRTLSKWWGSPIFSSAVESSLLFCAHQCSIFSECKVIIAKYMVVSLVVVVFAGSSLQGRLCRVVFVIAHCLNTHNIVPHETTAAEALISS